MSAIESDRGRIGPDDGRTDLDVGETWARVSQHPFTRLDLAQYDSEMQPVYERRTRSGRVYFDQIDRIAHRDAAAMVGSRVLPTVAPNPALTATSPQRRRERRERGSIDREFNPVDLRGRVRTAKKQEKTRQGLPKSWGNLRFADRRDDAREFLADTPLEKQHWMAIDTGLVFPLATRLSIPNRSKPGERHEANALYSRGALLEQQRVTSRRASELNSTIEGQLDLKGAGGESAPLQDPLVVTAVDAFKQMHCEYDERGIRSTVERKAEVRSVISELVDLFVGGLDRFTPAELVDHNFFVVVGAAPDLQDSQTVGAVTANVLLRQLPVEMRRRDLNFRIFLAPEYQTSQHCPRPRCTDTARRRSR